VARAYVFELANRRISEADVDEIDLATLSPERFAWLDLDTIDEQALRHLFLRFGLPEAEVGELFRPDREYCGFHHQDYILTKVLLCCPGEEGFRLVPLIVAMTPWGILTAREGPLAAVDKVHASYRESFASIGKSPAFIFFLLWDAIVDAFLPSIFMVDDALENLEDEYMEGRAGADILDQISSCKRMVRALKRSLAPMQRVMRHLAGTRFELLSDEARVYLGHLFDHMDRISQSIDSLQDRVQSALDGYNSVLTQQQNNALKVLTIIATIMMPLSLIAAIYGMNFDFMPELRTRYGYFVVLAVMVALGVTMLSIFKRRKWL